jgi:hypothetical protein
MDIFLNCASEVQKDVYFLSSQDAKREISRRKREIQALERLEGKKVVVAQNTIVTCYHSKKNDRIRMFRQGKEYT